jgi:ABC-type sugar transport system ATPase subunit
LLHVTAAGKDLVAIVDAEHAVKPGQELILRLPLDKLHVFDTETGLSLDVQAKAVSA